MTCEKVLQIIDLKKTYGKGDAASHALCGVTFDVLRGEFLGIMGASGSGKSTLLNCIATATVPTSGKILLCGKDISTLSGKELAEYRGKRIGYLFQQFELLDNLTARENIALPLSLHGRSAADANGDIEALAKEFGITDDLDKFPSELSGGQKQRTAAVRALITSPDILLADEPTGALDSKNSKILLDKLAFVNREHGVTVTAVTHDAAAAAYCSRILFIRDGKLFHELRRGEGEARDSFFARITAVTAQMGGGSANVL